MEKHYGFIKDNRLVLVAVFETENSKVAELVKSTHGYDSFIWLGETTPPILYSSYDGKTFTAPTLDYLFEIGIAQENQAMIDKRIAEAANTNTVE
jgi:hypothetical protein